MLHVQFGQSDNEKGAVKVSGPDEAKHGAGADWSKVARIAAGFAVGILLVWSWQEQGKAAEVILAVALGVALGVVAFSLVRR